MVVSLPTIEFIEEGHRYLLDGREVPSVSGIIESGYDFRFVDPDKLAAAADFGTKVHKAIQLHEEGRLNRATLATELDLRLIQWERFKADCGYLPEACEERVASKRWQYAGTMDSRGLWLPGFSNPTGEEMAALVDVKTGQEYPVHKLQTAGYKVAAVEMGLLPASTLRASVYLDADSYTVRYHDNNAADEMAFCGLAAYANWKRRYT